jgi:hypothetical protein
MIGDAMAQNPTFFTLWIGNNDVLLYSIYGGENSGQQVTSLSTFQVAYGIAIDTLISKGAKGMVGNIPDITDIPYFNTVPPFGLVLDANQAAQLNQGYAPYNVGAQAAGVPKITFQAGPNAFVIQDNTPPYNALGGMRQIRAGEMVLLSVPQDSLKPCTTAFKPWGSQRPIPEVYVLDATEIQKVKDATKSFNDYIAGVVAEVNQDGVKIGLVDFNAIFKQFNKGMSFDGIRMTTKFVEGGLFSLDGIHPNPRGYAAVANYYIDGINATFGSNIPRVNVSDYPGVKFP